MPAPEGKGREKEALEKNSQMSLNLTVSANLSIFLRLIDAARQTTSSNDMRLQWESEREREEMWGGDEAIAAEVKGNVSSSSTFEVYLQALLIPCSYSITKWSKFCTLWWVLSFYIKKVTIGRVVYCFDGIPALLSLLPCIRAMHWWLIPSPVVCGNCLVDMWFIVSVYLTATIHVTSHQIAIPQ